MHRNNHQVIIDLSCGEKLYDQNTISLAIDKLANQINLDILKENEVPVFLMVMNGAWLFASELMKRIKYNIISDYIHASRYGNQSAFGKNHITWFRQPPHELVNDKIVYVIDDVLDEGFTLAETKRFIMDLGAKKVKNVVLIDKDIGKPKAISADYFGIVSPNKFLFGYGLDLFGGCRHLLDIYYLKDEFL